jgi:hypothetical protein
MKSTQLSGLALMAGVMAGCGLFASKKESPTEDKPGAGAPELVGRIASIPADKRFVLIQSYGTWKIEPGTVLTTRGPEERSANLLVTGESLGQFAAADLQSGTVDIGDAVYSRHSPKPKDHPQEPAPEPELPENQKTDETENVQKNI